MSTKRSNPFVIVWHDTIGTACVGRGFEHSGATRAPPYYPAEHVFARTKEAVIKWPSGPTDFVPFVSAVVCNFPAGASSHNKLKKQFNTVLTNNIHRDTTFIQYTYV